MFDDLVECNPVPKRTNKPWTIAVSTLFQVLLLGVMTLIPLIYTEALPKTMLTTLLVAPPPPPPPPPPPAVMPVKVVKPMARLIEAGKLITPRAIPKEVNIFKEQEMPPDVAVGVVGGVPGGVPGGQAGGVLGGIIGGSNLPPPPKETPKRIRVGGQVQTAKLINKVQPVYPPLAKQARIQGTVRLQAVIAKDGSVVELQVLSGHPLLQQAALDAVRQWRYHPTLLNTEPVEVVTTIDVIFTLSS